MVGQWSGLSSHDYGGSFSSRIVDLCDQWTVQGVDEVESRYIDMI